MAHLHLHSSKPLSSTSCPPHLSFLPALYWLNSYGSRVESTWYFSFQKLTFLTHEPSYPWIDESNLSKFDSYLELNYDLMWNHIILFQFVWSQVKVCALVSLATLSCLYLHLLLLPWTDYMDMTYLWNFFCEEILVIYRKQLNNLSL